MITLLIGTDADSLLQTQTFQQQWNSLYLSCPWATIFQGWDFVTTWYQIYREPYKPVVVKEVLADGSLGGLLTLAVTPDSKQLIFAGAEQAEYHTWLARSDNGDTFIAAAMELLRTNFLGLTLTFQYLPPTAPKQWLADRPWAQTSILKPWTRPLMKLGDGSSLQKSLKKSSNKSRLNRMKRLGDVQFEQLYEPAELAAVFDDIIGYYDFRQGAVNDSVYFQTDPLRKPFCLALMQIKDLLHVTVLKIDDRVVAAHLGLSDGKSCALGIPAHSPFHAVHSPGKLQLLMLGVELAKQGFDALDLTPGGDPYKERFATDRDEVHILTVFLSERTWQKQSTELKIWARVTAGSIGKSLIGAAGIELATAKKFTEQLRRLRLGTVTHWQQSLGQQLWGKIEYRIYSCSANEARAENQLCSVNRDCLNDLLLFQSVDPRQTRQDFLSLCLTRLEAGQHVYTWVEQGCLLSLCWLVERQEKSVFNDLNQEYLFEPDSAVIYDYNLHPSIREQGYDRALLGQIVNDALFLYGAKQVYMTVLADELLCETIESTGFTHRQSISKQTQLQTG
jgi:CelD/BcsL family acetyltransferase involved in cellulose biosynthesis